MRNISHVSDLLLEDSTSNMAAIACLQRMNGLSSRLARAELHLEVTRWGKLAETKSWVNIEAISLTHGPRRVSQPPGTRSK